MIELFFQKVLSISVWALVFVVLLRCFLPFLRQRYNAWWRCLIWFLLTVRLLIPVTFVLQLPQGVLPAEYVQVAEGQEEVQYQITDAGEATGTVSPAAALPAAVQSLSPVRIAGWIWLAGVVLFAVLHSVVYIRFRHRISRFCRPAGTVVQESRARACEELQILHQPAVLVCPAISTPMVAGAFRPVLLLPHEQYREEELACIFRHELIHLRRGDLWYKLAILLVNCIHWFNPAVYLMAAEAAKDIEMACDEEAVLGMNKEERNLYGNCLIQALPKQRRMDYMMTTNFGSAKETMKMRLHALFDSRPRCRGWLGLCLMISVIAALGMSVPFGAEAAQRDYITIETTKLPLKDLPHIAQFEGTAAGRMQCGPYALQAGVEYTLTITWQEGGNASLNCVGINKEAVPNGTGSNYTITSGQPLQFTVPADGYYYTEIPKGLTRTDTRYELRQSVSADSSVTINQVEMLYNDDGSPYLHDTITNLTDKNIKEYHHGMMAFDQSGNPLKIRWNPFSDQPKSHYYLYDWGTVDIPAGTTFDVSGGWSLDTAGESVNDTESIAYVIYCFKEITFDDETTWVNPDYQKWLDTYQDKKVNLEDLSGYYPCRVQIQ